MARKSKASAIGTGNSPGDETFADETLANDELQGIEAAGIEDGDTPPSRPEAIADEPRGGTFAGDIADPLAVVVEAAISPEFEILEELEREGANAAEVAAGPLFARWREFFDESASWRKEVLDYSYAFGGEVLRANSPAAAVEAQIDFARTAYLRLLDHVVKVSGIYLNIVRQAWDTAQLGGARAKG
jgi:hypothetical protein